MVELSNLDIAIIIAYFACVVPLGFWVGRGERDAFDYFLAARTLPWYLIGFSFYASNMSGASFVGLVGAAYDYGMAVFNYEWTATLVLIFFAVVMLPTFLRARIYTVPEYLEARFDRRARWIFAGLTLLTLLFIDMSGALYAGGVVVSTLFPAVGLWEASAGLALLAGAYTLVGGLRAVVITDAVQAVLMILGAALIFWFGLREVGGWDALMTALDQTQTRLIMPADHDFLPWPGIGGVVLLGFYYWTLNQYFVQRALAARSLDQARKGALFGGLLKLPNLFLMILPGMIAVVLLPELDNVDQVFPRLAARAAADRFARLDPGGADRRHHVKPRQRPQCGGLALHHGLRSSPTSANLGSRLTGRWPRLYCRLDRRSHALCPGHRKIRLAVPVLSGHTFLPGTACCRGLFGRPAVASDHRRGRVMGHGHGDRPGHLSFRSEGSHRRLGQNLAFRSSTSPMSRFSCSAATFIVAALISLTGPAPKSDAFKGLTVQWGDFRPDPSAAGHLDYRLPAVALAGAMSALILLFW